MKKMNYAVISGAAINIALNALWIPENGAAGAAMATVITQWGVALGCMALSFVYFKWSFPFKTAGRLIGWWITAILFHFALPQNKISAILSFALLFGWMMLTFPFWFPAFKDMLKTLSGNVLKQRHVA